MPSPLSDCLDLAKQDLRGQKLQSIQSRLPEMQLHRKTETGQNLSGIVLYKNYEI